MRINDFQPFWRRLRERLGRALADGPTAATLAEPCAHCPFCEFNDVCEQQWRTADSLIYVAGIRKPEIAALVSAGVPTLTSLAEAQGPVLSVQRERLARLMGQAALQVSALTQPDEPPPFAVIDPGEDKWGHGYH